MNGKDHNAGSLFDNICVSYSINGLLQTNVMRTVLQHLRAFIPAVLAPAPMRAQIRSQSSKIQSKLSLRLIYQHQ